MFDASQKLRELLQQAQQQPIGVKHDPISIALMGAAAALSATPSQQQHILDTATRQVEQQRQLVAQRAMQLIPVYAQLAQQQREQQAASWVLQQLGYSPPPNTPFTTGAVQALATAKERLAKAGLFNKQVQTWDELTRARIAQLRAYARNAESRAALADTERAWVGILRAAQAANLQAGANKAAAEAETIKRLLSLQEALLRAKKSLTDARAQKILYELQTGISTILAPALVPQLGKAEQDIGEALTLYNQAKDSQVRMGAQAKLQGAVKRYNLLAGFLGRPLKRIIKMDDDTLKVVTTIPGSSGVVSASNPFAPLVPQLEQFAAQYRDKLRPNALHAATRAFNPRHLNQRIERALAAKASGGDILKHLKPDDVLWLHPSSPLHARAVATLVESILARKHADAEIRNDAYQALRAYLLNHDPEALINWVNAHRTAHDLVARRLLTFISASQHFNRLLQDEPQVQQFVNTAIQQFNVSSLTKPNLSRVWATFFILFGPKVIQNALGGISTR